MVHEASCVLKFGTFPTTGTTIVNEGTAGATYNATANDNEFGVMTSSATLWYFQHATDVLTVPAGVHNNLGKQTWEFRFLYIGSGNANGYDAIFGIGTNNTTYLLVENSSGKLVFTRMGPSGNYKQYWTAAGTVAAWGYYHVQISWDSASTATAPVIKVNNVIKTLSLSDGGATSWLSDTNSSLYIGNLGSPGYPFKGFLLFAKLHTVALSDAYGELINNYMGEWWRNWVLHYYYATVKFNAWPSVGTMIRNTGNAGSAYNATAVSTNRYAALASGASSWTYPINNSGEYLTVPAGAAVDNLGAMTLEFQFKLSALPAATFLWYKGPNFHISLGNTSGQLYIIRHAADGVHYHQWLYYPGVAPNYNFLANTVYHLQIVWDSTNVATVPTVYTNNVASTMFADASDWGGQTAYANDSASPLCLYGNSAYGLQGVIGSTAVHTNILALGDTIDNYTNNYWRFTDTARAARILKSHLHGGRGLWSDPATWELGVAPVRGDSVHISAGDIVYLDKSLQGITSLSSLTVDGTLQQKKRFVYDE
jgi:hypothetical protein